MANFENKFSWSKSRDDKFRTCPRQYYLHHYGSWGGWEAKASPRTKEIYTLKNLKSRFQWVGEIVHHVVENALKAYVSQGTFDAPKIREELSQRMHREFRESRDKVYRKQKKAVGLFEHEYEMNLADEKWKSLHDHALSCFDSFSQKVFPELLKTFEPSKWVLIETLQEFLFDGATVYIKVDLGVKDQDRVYIIDWKTGQNEDISNDMQLNCYGLFSKEYFKLPVESIVTVEWNLARQNKKERQLQESHLESAHQYLSESISGMRKLLRDIPKNVAVEEDFEMTTDDQICRYCVFKKVCPKWV